MSYMDTVINLDMMRQAACQSLSAVHRSLVGAQTWSTLLALHNQLSGVARIFLDKI